MRWVVAGRNETNTHRTKCHLEEALSELDFDCALHSDQVDKAKITGATVRCGLRTVALVPDTGVVSGSPSYPKRRQPRRVRSGHQNR